MASIFSSSVSFKPASHPLLLNSSSFTGNNYGLRPSVSFRRSKVLKMPVLRVISAAKSEIVDDIIKRFRSHMRSSYDTITEGSTIGELPIDSLDVIEIMMELEAKYYVDISDDKAVTMKTINDVAQVIEELTNKNAK